MFQYWNRVRGGRPAPVRSEIEPADIRTLLADTFILEQDLRGAPIFRLAGTRLCALFGRELKGFSFLSLWPEVNRRMIERLASAVFDGRSVSVITVEGISRNSRVNRFELLMLPLAGEPGAGRALGALSALEKPFWLGADPLIEIRAGAVRVIDPEREPMFLKNNPDIVVPRMAPSLASLQSTGISEPVRKIRHLTVISGGKDES